MEVRGVGARCDSCGYRSDADAFFRRAEAGMFTRERDVCRACEPYLPDAAERIWVRTWLGRWLLATVFGLLWMVRSNPGDAFVLVMIQAVFVGGILIIAW